MKDLRENITKTLEIVNTGLDSKVDKMTLDKFNQFSEQLKTWLDEGNIDSVKQSLRSYRNYIYYFMEFIIKEDDKKFICELEEDINNKLRGIVIREHKISARTVITK